VLRQLILVAHIAVLGYWLGAELVINSTYRRIAYGSALPFAERSRWMEHVMDADQHVRYALVLQAGLGFSLAALYGYVPGGRSSVWIVAILAAVWLTFVELTHRLRHRAGGKWAAAVDRRTRYLLIALLLALSAGRIGSGWAMPFWLRLKLALFAAVMGCGVGIRLVLLTHFRTWGLMAAAGPTPQTDAIVRRTYVRGTMILALLWLTIAAMVWVSIYKPK
jgi:hypothetical protein